MSYQEDYERVAIEMKAALEDLKAANSRVYELQRRMAALDVLRMADNPHLPRTPFTELSFKILHATSRPVDKLRHVFALSKGPLTVKELRGELLQAGCDLSRQANPSGTIGALCARLVEQGVIRRTKKGGRNAWECI